MEGLANYKDRYGNPIPLPPEDWEGLPASAKGLILLLLQHVKQLEEKVKHLEERLNLDSRNSSKPPSTDPPGTPRAKKSPTGRPRGGQKGHPGVRRELLPEDKVSHVVDHHPDACGRCGRRLTLPAEGSAFKEPVRHQVLDVPPVVVEVTEHRRHWGWCPDCHDHTLAHLPDGVPWGMMGPNLLALEALLTGRFRMSRRDVQEFLGTVLGVPVSLGAVKAQEELVTMALAGPVEEVARAIQAAPVVNADESGWKESDNRAWIWCGNTPDLAIYRITSSRSREAAKDLLGKNFNGILGTDRYAGYSYHPVDKRAVCWAHIKRDFERIAGRDGASSAIGVEGVAVHDQVFKHWRQFKDGQLSRAGLGRRLKTVRKKMQALLERGTACGHSKTQNTCTNLMKVFPALWTFASVEGVEPTNNSSERALRPAVRWRKVSFGSRSKAGSEFVERVMTVVETCRRQGRSALAYLREAVTALFHRQPPGSLIPLPGT